MLRYKQVPIAILTLLTIGVTISASIFLTDADVGSPAFWGTLAPVLFAEVLLGLSLADSLADRAERGEPFKFGIFILLLAYFGFTLAMLLVAPLVQATRYWWFIHIFVGLGMATLLIFSGMAKAEKNRVDAEFVEARKAKADFQTLLHEIADISARSQTSDASFNRHLSRLHDMARYAPETLPGAETSDADVRVALAKLKQAVETQVPASMSEATHQTEQALSRRESLIKQLRTT